MAKHQYPVIPSSPGPRAYSPSLVAALLLRHCLLPSCQSLLYVPLIPGSPTQTATSKSFTRRFPWVCRFHQPIVPLNPLPLPHHPWSTTLLNTLVNFNPTKSFSMAPPLLSRDYDQGSPAPQAPAQRHGVQCSSTLVTTTLGFPCLLEASRRRHQPMGATNSSRALPKFLGA